MEMAFFWTVVTVMVVMATAVLVVPLFWSQRAPDEAAARRRQRIALAVAVVAVPLVSLSVYSLIGSPHLLGLPRNASAQDAPDRMLPHAGARMLKPGERASDLAAATARLEARLAADPDDAAGWRLLAQAYRFAGRDADAQRAESMASVRASTSTAGASAPKDDSLAALVAAARARVKAVPRDRDAWATLAEGLRRQRDFAAALAAFARRAELGSMTADLWADYADAHGAAHGGLDETSARYIAEALKIDEQHPKALWLLGSYQTARGDYRGALATWDRLAALLPADSSDARIIAANRAEASAALAGTGVPAVATLRANVVLRGEVEVAPQWRSSVPRGATLFVVAKSVDDPGPPLAVYRTAADRLPVRFVLDDTLAMLPSRTLSASRAVIVEARISVSGRAEPQPGDLRAVSGRIDPRSGDPLRLVIAERIG